MLNIDICCCTYNSAKWFDTFFAAMEKVNYDKKKLHLFFTDNCSTDDTVAVLEKFKAQLGVNYGSFEIIQTNYNGGFGVGSNTSAKAGRGEIVFFYNVDTAIDPDAFSILSKEVENSPQSMGAFEMRQMPYEHPKYYNPLTLETRWASGAALALKREVFEKTGGFDESIFMYCEDVDLSWRIRLAGYTIKYLPCAVTQHFIPDITEMKPTQIAGQLAGEHILRYKFSDDAEVEKLSAIRRSWQPFLEKNDFAAQLAEKLLADVEKNKNSYRQFYNKNVKNSTTEFCFERGYDFIRLGAECIVEKPEKIAPITVIVRTYNRPQLLKQTLQSLCNQTAKDFKVIVVEDGRTPVSREMVESFESRLDISYIPMNANAGRCVAGNKALDNVKTDYAVFLDDDDHFFADYIEAVSVLIQQNPECKMFCSSSAEAEIVAHSADGSDFSIIKLKNNAAKNLRPVDFYYNNPVAIQSVVFHISLYHQYGGFDAALDAFEDWDLWMRYVTHCQVASTEKTLSLFKVPYGREAFLKRSKHMDSFRPAIFEKAAQYSLQFSAQDIISLDWTPETIGIYGEEDFPQLKDTALQIESSKTYRIASPFIRVFRSLSTFFAGIANWFGPAKPGADTDDYGSVQRFVIDAQEAPFMNKLTKLFNSIKK